MIIVDLLSIKDMAVNTLILGLGDRGSTYAEYSKLHPDLLQISGVADSNQKRLQNFASEYGLQEDQCYLDWEDLLTLPKQADAVIITLPDHLHYNATIEALNKDYHVLLEKPIATSPRHIIELQELAEQSRGILQICHVLRYTEFYQTIKNWIDSGKLGDVVTISMGENVAYYHYAHSYIRGNWHNRSSSAPILLTKSSHDLDLLYWFADSKPAQISSFGSQQHFGRQNKPEGAAKRCTDDCPVAESCLYYAPRLYLDVVPLLQGSKQNTSFPDKLIKSLALRFPGLKRFPPFHLINKYQGWPVSVITEDPTMENRIAALKTGPYGRCVYDIEDHDVIDHQVVNIEFENSVTASFTLHGHSSEERRTIRIDGTRGTLEGHFSFIGDRLVFTDSLTNKKQVLIDGKETDRHGGGDLALVADFVQNIRKGCVPITNGAVSTISHMMAFAGDKSRVESTIVSFQEFIRSI